MKRDDRLSNTLHALLHMAAHERPMTSDQLAQCLHTNAVVVRRTMAGLREAGLVASERGHGGGWSVARSLTAITLLEVNQALGGTSLMIAAPKLVDHDGCVVERAVIDALSEARAEANALMARRLSEITLADLAVEFTRRLGDPLRKDPDGRSHAS